MRVNPEKTYYLKQVLSSMTSKKVFLTSMTSSNCGKNELLISVNSIDFYRGGCFCKMSGLTESL